MPHTYQARAFGYDLAGDSVWVGVFPHGPLAELNHSSFALLDIVESSPHPLTIEDILHELEASYGDLPEHARTHIQQALNDFVARGFMTLQEDLNEH